MNITDIQNYMSSFFGGVYFPPTDLDDKVTAVDIYSTVWNLLEWLNNYSSQNEKRIKNIIERLETM